jgi:hypothetical protein
MRHVALVAFARLRNDRAPRPDSREQKEAAIAIVAALVVLALVAFLSALIAGRARGVVRLLAQTVAVILASLTGALVGFLIPLAPFADRVIGTALWAGILGTLGTIAGMSAAESLMTALDKRGS